MLNLRPGLPLWARGAAFVFTATIVCQTAVATPIFDAAPAVSPSVLPATDPVSRFLLDRGLVGAAAAVPAAGALVVQVRNKAADMVITAMNFIGVPYRRGGNTADSGFDCSGFTRQVFESSLGMILPRRADEQANAPGLVTVDRDGLQPGDLVFFNTLRRTFSHVGIYIGDGKFIHSPRPGGEVRVEDMRFMYWAKRFTGARRAEPVVETAAEASAPAAPDTPARALR
jgi:cell wall-associated NlpC family hydrolase